MNGIEFTGYRTKESIINTDESSSNDSSNIHPEDFENKNIIKMENNNAQESQLAILTSLQEQIIQLSKKFEEISAQNSRRDDNERSNSNVLEHDDRSENTISQINSTTMKDLKAHLDLITEFDGSNISVETFIFETKSILNEIPEELKNMFIRLIISKRIIKHARKMIDGYDIRSATDLFQILRNNFGDNKSYDIALLERSQCQQGKENVLEYNKKFDICHLKVKRAINSDSKLSAMHRSFSLSNEEAQGLTQYVRGLNQSIKLFVRARNPDTIREAQNLALETEKEESIARTIYGRSYSNAANVLSKSNQNPSYKNKSFSIELNKSKFPCHNCGRFGHFNKDCPEPKKPIGQHFQPRPNFQPRQQPSKPPNPINYTQSQEIEETPEQTSCSESTPPTDSELIHSWQTQEHQ